MNKLITISLRGGGILGKFLLTFLITKEISLEFQGEFSLVNANVALLIIFLGFDFYIYTNRLIVKDNSSLVFIFKNSVVFYICSYIVLIPIVVILYYSGFVQREILGIFFLLVIIEHFAQELFRIYIALERVLFANILFFLRSGFWSWIFVIYLFFSETDVNSLYAILLLWTISTLLAIIIGIICLPGISGFFDEVLDKKWILKGIKVGASMFIATIFLKIIEYSDRYLIDFFLDKKNLGIYSFYFQIANIINVIIFTLYISYIYPTILKSVYQKNIIELTKSKNKIYKSTLTVVVIVFVGVLIALPYVLEIMDKEELNNNISVLYVLILGALFFNFSFASHFVLIAEEREKLVIKSTCLALIINIVFNLVLIPSVGILGAAISLVASSLTLLMTKIWEEKKILKTW